MNNEKEELFVQNYIIKDKTDRLRYELNSKKKRIDALRRFCHSGRDYLDERKILFCTDDAYDSRIVDILNKYDSGYMICWGEEYDQKEISTDLAIDIISEDLGSLIYVLENECIVLNEFVEKREIIVLKK